MKHIFIIECLGTKQKMNRLKFKNYFGKEQAMKYNFKKDRTENETFKSHQITLLHPALSPL